MPHQSERPRGQAPEPEPQPKGARDLAKYIAAGKADDSLDALKADTRPTVDRAIKARREVLVGLVQLADLELPPEAGEASEGAEQ